MDVKKTRTTNPMAKPLNEEAAGTLGFGNYFSDHMFVMKYSPEKGWHDAEIKPLEDLRFHPAAMGLHYGQEIFEGMKAYRAKDGRVVLFRPYENAKRWNNSCDRMCMPQMDEEMFVGSIKAIVDFDSDWIPHADGTSLVLRPAMVATTASLGVHPSDEYLFFIITSPSGAYYPEGINPVSIYVEDEYIRAAKGGMGFAKTGGNYAGSMKAAKLAEEKGFTQVLWLDGTEKKYVEEVGAMNMMFVIDDTIVTAPLDGTILPGVTRASVLKLAEDKGWKVEERKLSIDEICKAFDEGRLSEAFGTGTAAVVSPVGKLQYKDKEMIINNFETGPKAKELYETLISIQVGELPDPYGWVEDVSR